jgi:LPS O-antigen subunit length determinant protein (WzzB/FepE family)
MISSDAKKIKESLRESIAKLESQLSAELNDRAKITTKLTIDGLKKRLASIKDDAKGKS